MGTINQKGPDLPIHDVDVIEEWDEADEALDVDKRDTREEFLDIAAGPQVTDDVEGHKEGAHEEECINGEGPGMENLPRKGLKDTY